jgi:predicted ribosome quality control (RQC) complex YloA/Tae2 family protein
MEAELDYTKSAQQNAESYFERSKEAKKKLEGAEQAIKRLEQKIGELEKEKVITKEIQKKEEREWYEKFYWFFTSDGLLAIGGRSAQQNELINSKYFEANDLFFHANIFGASVVVLKGGANAGDEARNEAAQFAACFSKAWENGQSAVDVFSAKRDQVSKSQSKGYLGTGSFLISGDREWYRNVKLELYAYTRSLEGPKGTRSVLNIAPAATSQKLGLKSGMRLTLGTKKKSDVAKIIAGKLGIADLDYIIQHLPPGEFSVK